ncbi:site-specific tyrosine recombinase XerC [Rahnella perminowiae]|uniref:site-specific tyrosine recombinase XerC n=1 Tax=Rahnella perminowiae TaxID=2816244 RepID=UPI001C252DF6|nr:site-specific tyrosine recombinase XerC [Rahnella perminowiae]MBU9823550.1 site-specific tyrosine recombinase XerC [Rahnella perminowiae]
MANQVRRKPRTPVGSAAQDPRSLYRQMLAFLGSARVRNYSEGTLEKWEEMLRSFLLWCDERGLQYPQEITRPILERYQHHLYQHRKRDGQPMSARGQRSYLIPIRAWFRWLVRSHLILSNPAADLDLPRQEHRLPKAILTADEADSVMNVPDITTPMGIRDRAILEVVYSTGIRRAELRNLDLFSIDGERGTLTVRQGKGRKDRVVPIGDRALAWTTRYLNEVRPELMLPGADDDRRGEKLFLTREGEAFSVNRLSHLVRTLVSKADVGKSGSCHLFRHTMATLMLENGADLRWIQAMLGHASPETTQIYAQVSIRALKEIHTATHPARLEGREQRDSGEETGLLADLSESDTPALPDGSQS